MKTFAGRLSSDCPLVPSFGELSLHFHRVPCACAVRVWCRWGWGWGGGYQVHVRCCWAPCHNDLLL